jgi:hypothetical protein
MSKYPRSRSKVRVRLFLMSMAIVVLLLSAYALSQAKVTPLNVHGIVAGTYFTPPTQSAPSSTVASHFQGARVCVDANESGVCDFGEASTTTDTQGRFVLTSRNAGPIVAEISNAATNAGHSVDQRLVLRASLDQVEEGAVNAGSATLPTPASTRVVITPLSTEVIRMMEADHVDYQTAKWNLAKRLDVRELFRHWKSERTEPHRNDGRGRFRNYR